MAANGNEDGKPCDMKGSCDASKGLTCTQDTGLCKFSTPGKHNDICNVDADCDSKDFPGLMCKAVAGRTTGVCDCSEKSAVLSKCSDTEICVSGTPGPAPPPAVEWPLGFANPSDDEKKLFTGACSAKTSNWYANVGGKCNINELACRGADNQVVCLTTDQWKGPESGVTCKNFCLQTGAAR